MGHRNKKKRSQRPQRPDDVPWIRFCGIEGTANYMAVIPLTRSQYAEILKGDWVGAELLGSYEEIQSDRNMLVVCTLPESKDLNVANCLMRYVPQGRKMVFIPISFTDASRQDLDEVGYTMMACPENGKMAKIPGWGRVRVFMFILADTMEELDRRCDELAKKAREADTNGEEGQQTEPEREAPGDLPG
jgi:hypothetical protein